MTAARRPTWLLVVTSAALVAAAAVSLVGTSLAIGCDMSYQIPNRDAGLIVIAGSAVLLIAGIVATLMLRRTRASQKAKDRLGWLAIVAAVIVGFAAVSAAATTYCTS